MNALPTSVYRFTKSPQSQSAYLMDTFTGEPIPWLLGVYVRGPNLGRQYVIFDEDQKIDYVTGRRFFLHRLDTTNKALCGWKSAQLGAPHKKCKITGGENSGDNPGRFSGDTHCPVIKGQPHDNDALLWELSPDREHMTIYFFAGLALQRQPLFEKWVNGELVLTAAVAPLPPVPETKTATRADTLAAA
jgi:hypothetical protein